MKIFKKTAMPVLTLIFILGVITAVSAQEKKIVEKSVEVKMSTVNDKTSIQIKIKKEDGTYFEKTYSSKEEMANDPELKELNMEFGEVGNIFKHKFGHDGTFEIATDEEGYKSSKVMFFKLKQSSESSSEGNHVWVQKVDGESGDIVFKCEDGSTYNITKDENGNFVIEKDGEPIDLENLKSEGSTLVEVKEDGTLVIKDGNKTTEIKMDGSGEGNAFFITENKVVHELDGDKKMLHFKGKDGDGNVWIEAGENGDHEVYVMKLHEIHIKILDLKSNAEISEIPNIHLNSGSNLDLEEVDYYPNPNSGEFTLRFQADKSPTQIKIVDMMGKEVYNEQITDFRGTYNKMINLSNNEPGLYILQVIQNDKSWSKKIVVE